MNDEPIPLEDEIYEEEIEVEEETSVTMAMWGDITGDIDNQTDLKEALDAKQNNLTQAQLDAVNSGINSTKVETYDGYQAQINTKASQSALDAEAEARRQADSTLQGKIDAEEIARKASDKDIQDVLDGETLARQNADTALGGRIDTEIHDRQVADIALQGQIDAITSKSDVVDVVATYADLQAYDTSTLGDNDVIKVLDDETHGDALTYYRWSKTNQTWTFIGQEAPYYSKSQTDTLLLGKQNTIDSSHKLSADLVDDTSTTNKFVTASDITNWNGKQDALTAGTGIDITGGVISTPAIVPEVVAELPTTGAEGKLYLTPKAHTTSTATGNPIEANITAQAGQLESFQLDGDTFQQSYTGKNLLGLKNPSSNTFGFEPAVAEESGTITVNGTFTGGGGGFPWISDRQLSIPAGTYTFSMKNPQSFNVSLRMFDAQGQYTSGKYIAAGATSGTFTLEYDCVRVAILIGAFSAGKTLNNQKFEELQLEAGSTATEFEPFVGGQPSPSPDYPQQIQTVTGEQTVTVQGKNLLNYNTIVQTTLNGVTLSLADDGTITLNGTCSSDNTRFTFDGLSLALDGTYTLSSEVISGTITNATNMTKIRLFKSGYSGGIRVDLANTSASSTSSASGDYILNDIRIDNGVVLTNYKIKIQLEKSATSTSFEPYSSTNYPISLGSLELCKLGTYQDYIYKDGDSWKVHKATGEVTLNGSETWFTASVNVWGSYSWANTTALTNFKPWGVSKSALFKDAELNTGSVIQDNYMQVASGGIVIRHTGSTTATAFKTWLESAKPMIRYQLATATDTTITDTNLIAQLEAIRTASLENGTNTITNTATGTNLAGDMEIGYYGFNPTNRYNKFIWLNLNNNYEQIGGE